MTPQELEEAVKQEAAKNEAGFKELSEKKAETLVEALNKKKTLEEKQKEVEQKLEELLKKIAELQQAPSPDQAQQQSLLAEAKPLLDAREEIKERRAFNADKAAGFLATSEAEEKDLQAAAKKHHCDVYRLKPGGDKEIANEAEKFAEKNGLPKDSYTLTNTQENGKPFVLFNFKDQPGGKTGAELNAEFMRHLQVQGIIGQTPAARYTPTPNANAPTSSSTPQDSSAPAATASSTAPKPQPGGTKKDDELARSPAVSQAAHDAGSTPRTESKTATQEQRSSISQTPTLTPGGPGNTGH